MRKLNYKQLYRLMKLRRCKEHKMLEEMGCAFANEYARVLRLENLYHQRVYVTQREIYNDAMIGLSSLMDSFRETDRLLSLYASKQQEPPVKPSLSEKESP